MNLFTNDGKIMKKFLLFTFIWVFSAPIVAKERTGNKRPIFLELNNGVLSFQVKTEFDEVLDKKDARKWKVQRASLIAFHKILNYLNFVPSMRASGRGLNSANKICSPDSIKEFDDIKATASTKKILKKLCNIQLETNNGQLRRVVEKITLSPEIMSLIIYNDDNLFMDLTSFAEFHFNQQNEFESRDSGIVFGPDNTLSFIKEKPTNELKDVHKKTLGASMFPNAFNDVAFDWILKKNFVSAKTLDIKDGDARMFYYYNPVAINGSVFDFNPVLPDLTFNQKAAWHMPVISNAQVDEIAKKVLEIAGSLYIKNYFEECNSNDAADICVRRIKDFIKEQLIKDRTRTIKLYQRFHNALKSSAKNDYSSLYETEGLGDILDDLIEKEEAKRYLFGFIVMSNTKIEPTRMGKTVVLKVTVNLKESLNKFDMIPLKNK